MKWTVIFVSALLFFSGCAKQPISTSLTELGSVSKARYGHKNLSAIQSININGLGSGDDIGTITYDPDRDTWRKYFDYFAEFPDTMAPRFTNGAPYILHTWSKLSDSGSDIISNKNAILNYQNQLIEYYRTQLMYDTLKQAATTADDENNSRILKTLVRKGYIADDSNMSKNINDELVRLANKASYLQNELNTSIDSLKKPGIMIARWETSSNVGTTIDALASLSSSNQSEKNLQGFVIIGEPHIVTFFFGSDFNTSLEKNISAISNLDRDHLYFTHHQLRAKHIAYAESSFRSLTMSLDADVSKLIQELDGLGISKFEINNIADELKVKLSIAYGRIASNTAEGFLSQNHTEKITCTQHTSDCLDRTDDFNTTLPIVSSRVSLKFFKGTSDE